MTKLWDKGYPLNKKIEAFTVGNDYLLDRKLVKYDAEASIAHAEMLAKIKILTEEEFEKLKKALKEIITLAEQEKFEITQEDEDCHTAIENYLIQKCGECGKKIHTARSRNDQVLASLRLYMRDEIKIIKEEIKKVIEAAKMWRRRNGIIKIPGYTHMQRAMPTTIGTWIGATIEALEDDLMLIDTADKLINQSPLGAGAGYGIPVIRIDREFVAKKLGFEKVQENTIYVQNSRGKVELFLLDCLKQIMLEINKLATDIMLYTTQEYGFLQLPKECCTGSSIMPQKKNPDVMELLRAKTGSFSKYSNEIALIITNLPSSYNRDFQLTKQPLIEAIETTKSCLAITAEIIGRLEVNKEKCETAAQSKELFMTEEAYKKVKKGMSFRDAYKEAAEEFLIRNNKHV